jgi:type I restriction enzyme S subunit
VGWPRRKLADLLEIQNGYAFDSKAFSSTQGTPLIRIRDLKSGTETATYFTGAFDRQYLVSAGDLLIGMDGEFACYEWRGEPALLNQRVCRLQRFSDNLLPRFLFYGINAYLKAIEDVTGFATVKHLSSKQVLGIEFPVPPIDEQRRVIAILDEAFEGIATARANAEGNLRNANALFVQRLRAVFEQQGAGWVERPVGAIAVHSLGKMLDKAKNRGVPRPYLRNTNVRWFGFDLTDVAEMKFTSDDEPKYTAVRGDLLVCEGGEPGRAAIWTGDEPVYFQKALHRVRCHEPAHNSWLLYYLHAMHSSGRLRRHLTGTGIQHLTGEALSRLPVPIAPLPDVHRIVAEFEELRKVCLMLVTTYQRKLAALDELKRSLLHHAFTGQLTGRALAAHAAT